MFRYKPNHTTLIILFPLLAALLILYATCLIPISTIPSLRFAWLPLPMDKIAHFVLFFIFSGSLCFSLYKKGVYTLRRVVCWTFLVPMLYGGIIELVQAFFIEQRSGEWLDFVADFLGSLSAMLLFLSVRLYLQKKKCRR